MWSLTLPQEAAILAATLVAFDTRNPAGQRLVDSRLLNDGYHFHSWTGSYGALCTSPPQRRNANGSNEDRRNALIP